MNSKAEKFLAKIAQRLAETTYQENLRSIFNDAVSSLPEKHSKLKKHIIKNVENYFKFYQKSLEVAKQSAEPSEIISQSPKSFVAELLINQNDTEKLVEILDNAVNNELKSLKIGAVIQKLCNIAISCQSCVIVHAIANALYSFFEREVELELKQVFQSENVVQLQENIFKVILLFNHQFQDVNPATLAKGLPKPSHILAALFSFYVDLSIHAGQSCCEGQNCSLLEISHLLFGGNRTLLLDSLSQTSQLSSANAAKVLDSIYSETLLHYPWNADVLPVPKYLQLMLVFRQTIQVMEGHPLEVANQYKSVALKILPPESFYKWVVGKIGGEDILDTTPITPDSDPKMITDYLVNKAELETIEDLVDLCHAGSVIKQKAEKPKIPEDSETALPDSLFFIDTKPHLHECDESDVNDMKLPQDKSDSDYNLSDNELDSDVQSSNEIDDNIEPSYIPHEPQAMDDELKAVTSEDISPQAQENETDKHTSSSDDSESDKPTQGKKSTAKPTPRKRKSAVRTRKTPHKQVKVIETEPELPSIPEEFQVDAKCSMLEVKPKKRIMKTRSDSESSTGSHSYSTRSRSRNT